MSLQNKFYDAPEPDKVVFEVVFSEKEGGGTVDVTDLEGDLPAGSVVGLATGNIYKPIKGATLVKAIGAEDTTIEIAKGSGFKQGEFIAFGGKAVAISAINSSDASKDVLTTAHSARSSPWARRAIRRKRQRHRARRLSTHRPI